LFAAVRRIDFEYQNSRDFSRLFLFPVKIFRAHGTRSTVPIGTLGRQDAMRRSPIHPPFAMPYFRTASTEYCEHVGEYRQ
jgi:hypothetical protein